MSAKFFITISPSYRSAAPKVLYAQDMFLIHKYLNPCSDHYILYPEFSDESRLHYHGIILFKDVIKFHKTKHLIDKTIGFTKIVRLKSHEDHLRVLIYSMKGWPATRSLLGAPIMPKKNKKIKKIVTDYLDQYQDTDIIKCFNQDIKGVDI